MRNLLHALAFFAAIDIAGCGSASDLHVLHGSVSVAGQKPDSGEVRFVPIEGTEGSINAAVIVDGKYRIAGRGGVPTGKYRVEVVAKRKTGRQVRQYNGFETAMVDQQVPTSPPIYAGSDSPLIHEVLPHGDDKIDFELPAN